MANDPRKTTQHQPAAGELEGSSSAADHEVLYEVSVEEVYWRDNFRNEPYHDARYEYDDYGPAYRAGAAHRNRLRGRSFEDAEEELRSEYESGTHKSRLDWDSYRRAARAAWDRIGIDSSVPQDSD